MRKKAFARSWRSASRHFRGSDVPIAAGGRWQGRRVAGIGSGEPCIRVARVADLDALARMWERLENYHADLGGPEHRLPPRSNGDWQRVTRGHIGHQDRIRLVAAPDGTTVGLPLRPII